MRYLLILILSVSCIAAQSQQINPVPDYIFRNQMSVGRNAVTDTAAYMSIGPRYGANKGLMPPIVVDTLTVTASPKRNGLLIFSVQKNKYVYWDSVRVQWSDMAGSSGSYIKGSGTITYIPKFTDSITLGNSAMYDSSGFVRLYKNNIGNTFNHDIQTPVAGLTLVKDGMRGYPLIIQQNDSLVDNIQLAILLRKGLLVSDTIKNGYGVGLAMNLQNNERTWVNSGWIANRIVDSAAATFKSEMAFLVNNSNSTFYPLIVRPDSTIRVLKLSGSGVRNVVADANGDLSIGSASNSVDTLSIATRAWRQKGDDSLGAIIATKQNTLTNPVTGTGTTNYLPKWSSSSAQSNSQLFDNGNVIGFGITPSLWLSGFKALQFSNMAFFNGASNGGFWFGNAFINSAGAFTYKNTGVAVYYNNQAGVHSFSNAPSGTADSAITFTEGLRITPEVLINTSSDAGDYKLQVNGNIYSNNGAALAVSAGNVRIGTVTDGSVKLDVVGNFRNTTGANLSTASGNVVVGSTGAGSFKLDVTGTSRFTSFINAQATTTAANGSINIESSDPALRYRITGGVANKRIFEQRAYASSGTTGNYAVRLWNDAESSVTELFKLDDTGTGTFTNGIDVIGRARVRTIDSTSTAMNMLYADATGVIKKAAVPEGNINWLYDDFIQDASGWDVAKGVNDSIEIYDYVRIQSNDSLSRMSALTVVFYRDSAGFAADTWVNIGTLPQPSAPKRTIYGALPNFVDGADYLNVSAAAFTGAVNYSGKCVYRIKPNGDIDVRVGSVTSAIQQGGTAYVIFPITASFELVTTLL